MKESAQYIFQEGKCLTPQELDAYVAQRMSQDDAYKVEHHLLSCALCSDAVEGLMWAKENQQQWEVPKADFLNHPSKTQTPFVASTIKSTPYRRYAAAAALLLFIVGAGYGVYRYTKAPDTTLATVATKDTEQPIIYTTDSIITTSTVQESLPSKQTPSDYQAPKPEYTKANDQALPTTKNEDQALGTKTVEGIAANTPEATARSGSNAMEQKNLNKKNVYPAPVATNNANQQPAINNQSEATQQKEEYASAPIDELETVQKSKRLKTNGNLADELQVAKDYYYKNAYRQAITYLENILTYGTTDYYNEAKYYAALAYDKLGKATKAAQYLNELANGNSEYAPKAKTLLQQKK